MTGRRILFADDDPGVQRALKRLAEKNGFELRSRKRLT
jgi:CheY-like chemotaxis protein